MTASPQKFSGWILLIAGLAIIFWSLYSSFNIFIGKSSPPQIFKIEKEEPLTPLTKGKTLVTQTELQEEMEKIIREQLKGLIPSEILSKLLNLISWSIFAGILILAGAQMSGLGIKLLKR